VGADAQGVTGKSVQRWVVAPRGGRRGRRRTAADARGAPVWRILRAMAAIGRNEPCPCGSGRKYKKCCFATGGGGAPYTQTDREVALQRLLGSIHADDMDAAREYLWGKHFPVLAKWKDPALLDMAECALQGWVCFDELDDGETLAEDILQHERDLGPGVRRYIETGRASAMKLYEVVAVAPGSGITLRDVLDGVEVRVRERSGSRLLHAWDLVAARVMARGASGQPEIDCGLFPLGERVREPLVAHLRKLRAELDEEEFKEASVPIFFDAWIGPGLPKLVNFDGEAQLMTTVHFDVIDEARLVSALDHAPEVSSGEAGLWTWVGTGQQRKEPVTRAFLRLDRGRLRIETNSRERGEAVRALVERLAEDAVRYRITEHQDIERAVLETAGAGHEPAPLPEELREPAREAIMQRLVEHYEHWLDEPVPALGDVAPRAAAADAALREHVAGLIEGLEGLYEKALAAGEAAYDPTWMWEELHLEDLARGRSHKPLVPRLPHEVIAELDPEVVETAAEISDRARRASREDVARVIDRQEVEGDLGFHRVVRAAVRDAKEDGSSEPAASSEGRKLAAWIGVLANFELHLRKTFWVDESLAWMLGATGLDIAGDALRPPFACFALVFTDRYALGLAERLLAEASSAMLRGRILTVLTVYVTSGVVDEERGEMRIAFAADADDGGWPELVMRDMVVRGDAGIAEILRTISPGEEEGEALSTIVASPPLRGLLGLVFNAILYATSADVDAVPGDPRGKDAPAPRRRRNGQTPPTGGVFRLPGKIDITALRQLKRVRRGASDVQATRRCMVRGHWRRAGKSWKDDRPRWIKPYWRGPGTAAIVEREYRLR
jgi:SEC-C motif